MKERRVIAYLSPWSVLNLHGEQLCELLGTLDRHRFERYAYLPDHGPLAQGLISSGVEVGFHAGLSPQSRPRAGCWAAAKWLLARRFDLVQAEGLRPALVSALRKILRPGKLVWLQRRPPLGPGAARMVRKLGFLPDCLVIAGRSRAEDFPSSWQKSIVRIEDSVEIIPATDRPARGPGVDSELPVGPVSPELDWDLNQLMLQALRLLSPELPRLRLAVAGPAVFRRAVELQARTLGLESLLRPVASAGEVAIAVVNADPAAPRGPLAQVLAAGVPTVAIGGELPANVALNVSRRDLEAVAAALSSLAQDQGLAEQLSTAGRAYAAAEFGARRRTQRFEELYNQLLA